MTAEKLARILVKTVLPPSRYTLIRIKEEGGVAEFLFRDSEGYYHKVRAKLSRRTNWKLLLWDYAHDPSGLREV